MTPEASYLLSCVRQFVGQIKEAAAPPAALDKAALFSLANEHCVSALLPDLPDSRRKEQVLFNMGLTAELLRLLAVFQKDGIAVMPVKGPVLAELVYGDLTLRTFSDIDLLVQPADRDQACRLLLREGYALTATLHWPNRFRSKEDQLPFQNARRGINVDLHWSLVPAYYPQPVSPVHLWAQLKSARIAGQSVLSLNDEDSLLFLCAHGSKHLWNRLGWICDVARLLQVCESLDWRLLLSKAQKQRCHRILLLGLSLANEVLGTPLPAEISKMIAADDVVRSRAQQVRSDLFENDASPRNTREIVRFNLPLLESMTDKLRYLHGMVLAPTMAEYALLQLPPWLYSLYYPLRVARIYLSQSSKIKL